MLEWLLLEFFVYAPIMNWAVIIGSGIAAIRAFKGKSPVGWLAVGIAIFLFQLFGDFMASLRNPSHVFMSEENVITIAFFVIYLAITMPLIVKKYNKMKKSVYYCVSCDATQIEDTSENLRCLKCGAPLIALSVSAGEWDNMTHGQKSEFVEQIKHEHEKMAPLKNNVYETENVHNTQDFSEVIGSRKTTNDVDNIASEIRAYKELLDDGLISQEEFDAKKKQLLGL